MKPMCGVLVGNEHNDYKTIVCNTPDTVIVMPDIVHVSPWYGM